MVPAITIKEDVDFERFSKWTNRIALQTVLFRAFIYFVGGAPIPLHKAFSIYIYVRTLFKELKHKHTQYSLQTKSIK